jgi:hypothetical protein
MAATFVTKAELRANLGIGSLYSDAIVEEVCQSAENLVKKQLWYNNFPVTAAAVNSNYCYLVLASSSAFVAGQEIVVTGCGSKYNGTRTITSTYPWTTGSAAFPYFTFFPFNGLNYPRGYSIVQFAATGSVADEAYHLIQPYGKAAGEAFGDSASYATVPEIREASLMIATAIFQARQQSNAGGVGVDFAPSPFTMGSQLLARVRGLLAPYLSPRNMVG